MRVIAAGFTPWKMDRLLALIPPVYGVTRVFAGPEGYPGAIQMPDNLRGKDAAMYARGVEEHPDQPDFWLLHDDLEYVDLDALWPESVTCEVRGVPNLSSWIDLDRCRDGQERKFHVQRGTDVLFIRNAALYMTAARFREVWTNANGCANGFEKGTITGLGDWQYELIPPESAVDSNTRRFVHAEA